jgi:Protein of unknown function (DUF2924)
VAERSGFELSVPISKLADDNFQATFATSDGKRSSAARSQGNGHRHLWGTCGLNRRRELQVADWISRSSRAFMRSARWTGRSAAAKLKTAEKAELLARWRANMGTPPPFAPNRELLAMALAWHLQERKYGGLKPLVQRRLEALANADRRGKLPAALLQACSFRPGTPLVKLSCYGRSKRHQHASCSGTFIRAELQPYAHRAAAPVGDRQPEAVPCF